MIDIPSYFWSKSDLYLFIKETTIYMICMKYETYVISKENITEYFLLCIISYQAVAIHLSNYKKCEAM